MKIAVLLTLVLTSCYIVADPVQCIDDFECQPYEYCSSQYVCVAATDLLPPGHILEHCSCHEFYLGEGFNESCWSRKDITFVCDGWCPNGDYPVGLMCY